MIQAIELYRKANHFLEAARLLADLARDEAAKRASPLRVKKLYVLSALLVEEHLQNIRKTATGAGVRSGALIGLGGDAGGVGEARVVDNAWRGAEAFHFLMLCQVRKKTVKIQYSMLILKTKKYRSTSERLNHKFIFITVPK